MLSGGSLSSDENVYLVIGVHEVHICSGANVAFDALWGSLSVISDHLTEQKCKQYLDTFAVFVYPNGAL